MKDKKILEVEKFANEMIHQNIIVSTEVMPLDKAKKLGAMALFSEKYGDLVRVVKIGKSIELCGGTHTTNTKEIGNLAIYNCESKGSNVYRIEAVTNNMIESTLYEVIKPYNDEKVKLLLKAREILDDARNKGIRLEFDVDINNDKPTSYKDIIYYKNEIQYIQQEVKDLEKKYYEIKQKSALDNLDLYREHIETIGDIDLLIMVVDNKEVSLLKTIMDALVNEMSNGFIVFLNKLENGSINILAKSGCHLNAGYIVKKASILSDGNGGGSPTFAQGGGKNQEAIDEIIEFVKDSCLKDE